IDSSRLHPTQGWIAGTPALGVRYAGNTVLVAAGAAGLITVDVTNPRAPQLVATTAACLAGEPLPCARSVTRVALQGTIAWLSTSAGMVAVDVADRAKPIVLSATGTNRVEDVAISGHLGFAAAGTLGLSIFDVTAPAAPVQLLVPQIVDGAGAPRRSTSGPPSPAPRAARRARWPEARRSSASATRPAAGWATRGTGATACCNAAKWTPCAPPSSRSRSCPDTVAPAWRVGMT